MPEPTTVTVSTPAEESLPSPPESVPAPIAAQMAETAGAAGAAVAASLSAQVDVAALQARVQELETQLAHTQAQAVIATEAAVQATADVDALAEQTAPAESTMVDVPPPPAPSTEKPEAKRGFWATLFLGTHHPRNQPAT